MSTHFINIRLTFLLVLIVVISGCADLPKKWDPQGYTVKSGDTLYSIAWRYEKDFRQIASINNIQSPYAIFPGQRLRMQASDKDGTTNDEGVRPQVLIVPESGEVIVVDDMSAEPIIKQPVVVKERATHAVVRKNDTLYAIARREGYTHHQLARWNHLRSPYVLKPGKQLRLSPPSNSLGGSPIKQPVAAVVTPLKRQAVKISSTPTKSLPVKVDRWNWPVKGKIIKTYRANDTARKGIGITGRLGQSVKAAAGGTVVYSGNGLINYGNLIIIKHSHSFLSAYAYNQSLLVKEGDSVKRGQSIAKMGKSDTKAQLHFEIRRNGKPVNPLHYLPKS